jgi:hypothetical protein
MLGILSTLIVGLAVAALVAAIVVKLVRDKLRGRNSCGASCNGCPIADTCHAPARKDCHCSGVRR